MDRTWLETHLPLLRYGDELSAEQVARILEQLEQLPDSADLRAQVEGVGHALDALSLEHPHPERLRSLKEQVLLAVQAPFAPGEPVLDVEPLPADEQAGVEAALSLVGDVPAHPGLANLRAAVLSQLDAPLPAAEQAGIEAALNLAGDVPAHPGLANLRGAILDRVEDAELTPSAQAEVEAALDLWADVPRPAGLDALKGNVLAEVGAGAPAGGTLVRFPAAVAVGLLAAAAVALVACGIALGGWASGGGVDATLTAALKRTADFAAMNGRFEIASENYRLIIESNADPKLVEQARQELNSIRDYREAQSNTDPLERQRQVAILMRDKPDALVVPLAFYNDLNRGSTAAAIQSQQLAFDPSRALRFDELGVPQHVRDILTDPTLQVILIKQGMRWEELGDLTRARTCYERAVQIDPDSKQGEQAKLRLTRLG